MALLEWLRTGNWTTRFRGCCSVFIVDFRQIFDQKKCNNVIGKGQIKLTIWLERGQVK